MAGRFGNRWTAGVIALGLFLALPAQPVRADQRLYARVEPNVEGAPETLLFDVNVNPTDNISPNIVFTGDSKHGFVSYTGSGVIVVFSVQTGEILHRIRTGGKPFYATPTPDMKTLIVVSVLDNRIFIVDTASFSLKATYTFDKAQFGFGSIVTLSPDGATGYVSSTGTGEVIKFSVANGSEDGRFKGLVFPAQITLTPDGAILLVVDVADGVEQLVFVNASNLTRRSILKATDKVREANFTIFNKAVLTADGKTGIIASRDYNGLLGRDTAFLFNVETAQILETATVGFEPGYTTLTPDGKNWIVFSEFSIVVIPTDDFKGLYEMQVVRGEPLGSSNIAFSADSRYLYYASAASDTVFQHELATGAVVGQVLVGDNPNEFLDQPSTVAITPDGRSVAVVEFVSNNISLLTDVSVLAAARFIYSEDKFTGLSLINLSSEPNNLLLIALNDFGQVITGEGVINPAIYDLEPNHQISLTVTELFNLTPEILPEGESALNGWISVFAYSPEVAGYVTIGDNLMTDLDGTPLFRKRLHDWIVPEIVNTEDNTLLLNLLNPNYNNVTYNLAWTQSDGTLRESAPGRSAFSTGRQSRPFAELFFLFEDVLDGYIRAFSREGLYYSEFLESAGSLMALNAIDVQRYAGIQKIYAPQFAMVPGFRTLVNIINANEEDAEVTLTLRSPSGAIIGEPVQRSMPSFSQWKEDLAAVFSDVPGAQNATGWLEIESTRDLVLGTITFTGVQDVITRDFNLIDKPLEFELLSGYRMRIRAKNILEQEAEIVLTLRDPEGETVGEPVRVTLQPAEELNDTLMSLFAGQWDLLPAAERLEIASSREGVPGTVTYTERDEKFRTSFELAGTPLREFLFPIAAQNEDYHTGVALLNPNSDPADVTIELWGPGGTLDRTADVKIAPDNRIALYLNQLFTGLEPRLVGNIRVRSTQPLVSFSLVNDLGLNFLTALPPIPLP